MNYIIRKSVSNLRQNDAEQLQGGHIFRFEQTDIKKYDMDNTEQIVWECTEIWVDNIINTNEITSLITNNNLIFNDFQLLYLINNKNDLQDSIDITNNQNTPVLTLEELKSKKISEFSPIINEFTLLITRAKIISGESESLNNIIEIIKNVKNETILKINNAQSISELFNFSFNENDIKQLKDMLNPFLY